MMVLLKFQHSYYLDGRLKYELEAYRVWVAVAPEDIHRIVNVMMNSYGFNLSYSDALEALTKEEAV